MFVCFSLPRPADDSFFYVHSTCRLLPPRRGPHTQAAKHRQEDHPLQPRLLHPNYPGYRLRPRRSLPPRPLPLLPPLLLAAHLLHRRSGYLRCGRQVIAWRTASESCHVMSPSKARSRMECCKSLTCTALDIICRGFALLQLVVCATGSSNRRSATANRHSSTFHNHG